MIQPKQSPCLMLDFQGTERLYWIAFHSTRTESWRGW